MENENEMNAISEEIEDFVVEECEPEYEVWAYPKDDWSKGVRIDGGYKDKAEAEKCLAFALEHASEIPAISGMGAVKLTLEAWYPGFEDMANDVLAEEEAVA